ncbi:MAG: superinfection immunity protein [Hyphomonadaceae bacterium]
MNWGRTGRRNGAAWMAAAAMLFAAGAPAGAQTYEQYRAQLERDQQAAEDAYNEDARQLQEEYRAYQAEQDAREPAPNENEALSSAAPAADPYEAPLTQLDVVAEEIRAATPEPSPAAEPDTAAPANAPPAAFDTGLAALVLAAILIALCAFFVPSWIAFQRRHEYRWIILALNIGAGWSGVGWLGALVWALWPRNRALAEPIFGDATGIPPRA